VWKWTTWCTANLISWAEATFLCIFEPRCGDRRECYIDQRVMKWQCIQSFSEEDLQQFPTLLHLFQFAPSLDFGRLQQHQWEVHPEKFVQSQFEHQHRTFGPLRRTQQGFDLLGADIGAIVSEMVLEEGLKLTKVSGESQFGDECLEVWSHADFLIHVGHEGLEDVGHDVSVFVLNPPAEVLVLLFLQ